MPERVPKTIFKEPNEKPLESEERPLEDAVDLEERERKERESVIEQVMQEAAIKIDTSVSQDQTNSGNTGLQYLTSRIQIPCIQETQ